MHTANKKNNNLILRKIKASDCHEILRWRNDLHSRVMSLSSEIVEPGVHEAWFDRLLADEGRYAFLGMIDGKGIGWVRFDPLPEEDTFLASITVAPEMRSKGLGKTLLRLGIDVVRTSVNSPVIHAQVKSSNIGSKNIFKYNGFIHVKTDKDIEYLMYS